MESKRVLVVDDEESMLKIVRYALEEAGFRVETAPDAEEAGRLVRSFRPDLVVLDVMLPGMNGFEVCQRIRGEPRWRGTRILMLTAKGRDTEVQKGLALGADAYVTKPFSTKDLVVQIRMLLGAPR